MSGAEPHRPWAFEPAVIQILGVAYGIAMGLSAMAALGSFDLIPIALLLAFPLGVLGPVGCLLGTPMYYAWICSGLSSGRATVRVPILLCLSYAISAALWTNPSASCRRAAYILFSQDAVSIWVGLVLYGFGQVWLWSCWLYIRRSKASAPPTVDTDVDSK